VQKLYYRRMEKEESSGSREKRGRKKGKEKSFGPRPCPEERKETQKPWGKESLKASWEKKTCAKRGQKGRKKRGPWKPAGEKKKGREIQKKKTSILPHEGKEEAAHPKKKEKPWKTIKPKKKPIFRKKDAPLKPSAWGGKKKKKRKKTSSYCQRKRKPTFLLGRSLRQKEKAHLGEKVGKEKERRISKRKNKKLYKKRCPVGHRKKKTALQKGGQKTRPAIERGDFSPTKGSLPKKKK